MMSNRDLVIEVFEDTISFFCQSGVPLSHQGREYIVVFYRHGRVREVSEYKHGQKDGVQIRWSASRMPSSIVHYRRGSRFGELKLCDQQGRVLKSVFIRGGQEIRMADADPSEFAGYIVTKDELKLDEAFEPHGAFLRSFT